MKTPSEKCTNRAGDKGIKGGVLFLIPLGLPSLFQEGKEMSCHICQTSFLQPPAHKKTIKRPSALEYKGGKIRHKSKEL